MQKTTGKWLSIITGAGMLLSVLGAAAAAQEVSDTASVMTGTSAEDGAAIAKALPGVPLTFAAPEGSREFRDDPPAVSSVFASSLSGAGTEASPYLLYTEADLMAVVTGTVDNALSAYYELKNDITLTAAAFRPIGSDSPFIGVFDGNGFTIATGGEFPSSGLTGLFGTNSGTIRDLHVDMSISNTTSNAGLLVGSNEGSIDNCSSSGSINSSTANLCIGGLVGSNSGIVKNSSSDATVTAASGHVGGLIGRNTNTVEASHASGDVTSPNGNGGGLIGTITGNAVVEASYATGTVSAATAGGLIGYLNNSPGYGGIASAAVRYCYATGTVAGGNAGGLIGYDYSYSSHSQAYNTVEYCYAQGNVTGTAGVGGLIGCSTSDVNRSDDVALNTVRYCYATGVVNDGNGGGLIGGYNNIDRNVIRYCYYNSKNTGNKIGFGATATKMRTQTPYYNWNFDNIWSLENATFPYIRLNGTYSGIDIEGFGDDDDPYIIENEKQLIAMFDGEIGPSTKAYYELANDITITASYWTPIGANGTAAFNGVFDGKGHTISGITLKNSHYSHIGFFGENVGIIKNLNVVVNLEGNMYVGGLAAVNSGTIENCTVSGQISGISGIQNIGGLVGYNSGVVKGSSAVAAVKSAGGNVGGLIGQNTNVVQNSFATGDVTSTGGNVGGLIGQSVGAGVIESAYATGNVASTGYTGGLIGYLNNSPGYGGIASAAVRYCYATGTVSGGYAGGLIGYDYSYSSYGQAYNTVEYCYAQGNVTGTVGVGGLIGYSTSDANRSDDVALNTVRYCYATGIVNDGNGGGLVGDHFNIDRTVIRYCYYNSQNTGNQIGFGVSAGELTQENTYDSWNFDNIWSLNGTTYPHIRLNGTYYGVDIEGSGEDYDPYIIENEEQLIAMANGEIGPSTKAYYELANDITITASYWTPIGANGTAAFNGVFDGKGYTVSGITLKNSHYSRIGFFGENAGTIKNLNVVVDLEGPAYNTAYIGGIAAVNDGIIENCTVSGTISGKAVESIGGLVGYNNGTVKNASSVATVTAETGYIGGLVGQNLNMISHSFATGTVSATGKGTVGGLVGYNRNTVEYAYATGNVVSASGEAGGLVGYLGNAVSSTTFVRYSFATGAVSGNNAGGLVGYDYSYGSYGQAYNTVEYCYAVGNVTGSTNAGGLIGYSYSENRYGDSMNTVQYCYAAGVVSGGTKGGAIGRMEGANTIVSSYYDTDKSTCSDTGRGTPLSGASMKVDTSYADWNFTDVWAIAAAVNNGYPYLRSIIPTELTPVTGITISDTNLTLKVGCSEKLTATIAPADASNKTVMWDSTNANVADVSNGLVTAKAEGTATITVTTADGGYTAECEVTVVSGVISVTGVTVSPTTLSMNIGDSRTLSVTVAPADATDKKVTWTSTDPAVASVNNGVVTANAAGTATVTAKTADGNYTASCVVTVKNEQDENAPRVTIANVKAKKGNQIEVTVELANNTGFSNLAIEIGYNSAVMTLDSAVSSVSGASLTMAQTLTANPYNMQWDSVNDITFNGTLATLTFTVKDTAPNGVYPITVDFYKGRNGDNADGDDVNYTADYEPLGLTYVDGGLTVYSYIPGDLNGDGKVNNKDATQILRYFADWKLPDLVEEALDVDGNGKVNNKDATHLLRYFANWEVELH